ncbi:MAG: hypothetical protein JSV52_12520 [Candidatus Zixiibacteriota bacterium]|nr:MAG: hypothetical protein JSV52_12520 [candidate division Zixibacteria bacterium]
MRFKFVLSAVLMAAISVSASGQARQNLVQGQIDHGFYVGSSTKLTDLDGVFTPIPGARAGLIIDRTFMIGAAAYFMLDKNETDFVVNDRAVEILLTYGGLQLMYAGNSDRLFHYEAGTLIGFGGLNYTDRGTDLNLTNSSHIFVLEPEAALVLNVTDHVQVSSGLSYRWIVGNLEEEVVKDSDLSGPALSLMLSVGAL